jgi:hypothetical protein
MCLDHIIAHENNISILPYPLKIYKIVVAKQSKYIGSRLAIVDQGGQKNCNGNTIAVFFCIVFTSDNTRYMSHVKYIEHVKIVMIRFASHIYNTFTRSEDK